MTYLAYAGIGSRKTPKTILQIMHALGAHLASEGWTLRSGGADGADMAFEQGHDAQAALQEHQLKEIYLPWGGFNNNPSALHPGNYPFTSQEMDLAQRFHPYWDRCSPAARKMHTRNVRQILGLEAIHGPEVVPVKFVVTWTEGGAVTGGTGQALRIAEACQIPIINLGLAQANDELDSLVNEVERLQRSFK